MVIAKSTETQSAPDSQAVVHNDWFSIEPSEAITAKDLANRHSKLQLQRVEDRELYRTGGYHPVEIGDDFEGRFKVMHKLGYGKSSTVWLCRDEVDETLVALKILIADRSSESSPELIIKRHFRKECRAELEFNQIFIPLEHFWIKGPNGRHLCFVSQLLGPTLNNAIPGIGMDTPEQLIDMCYQASRSLSYLHKAGICHGDFRPEKLMMQLDYEAMSGRDMEKYFGPIIKYEFGQRRVSRSQCSAHPTYLVESANLEVLGRTFRTGVLAVTGFGQACLAQGEPQVQRLDLRYAPPEVLIHRKRDGYASDMWSLGCTIYSIRMQGQLISDVDSISRNLAFLSWAFGPFPPSLVDSITQDIFAPDSPIHFSDGRDQFELRTHPEKPSSSKKTDRHYLPRNWGKYREELSRAFYKDETTSGNQKTVTPVFLPKDQRKWRKVRQQRERYTGYPTILHEDLSRERIVYERPLPELDTETSDDSDGDRQDADIKEPNHNNPGEWTPPHTPFSEWDPIKPYYRSERDEVKAAFTQQEMHMLDIIDRNIAANSIKSRGILLHCWEEDHYPLKAKLKEGVREQIQDPDVRSRIIRFWTPELKAVSAKAMSISRERIRKEREEAENRDQGNSKHAQDGSKGEPKACNESNLESTAGISPKKDTVYEAPIRSPASIPHANEINQRTNRESDTSINGIASVQETIGLMSQPSAELDIGRVLLKSSLTREEELQVGVTTPRDTIWPKDIRSIDATPQSSLGFTSSAKRPIPEIDWKGWELTEGLNTKRPRTEFLIEHTSRDLVEAIEEANGEDKILRRRVHRLQKEEVYLLADFLNGLLRSNPRERAGWRKVLRHKWFGKRPREMVSSYKELYSAKLA